jgi:phosphopantetheinyl transferase
METVNDLIDFFTNIKMRVKIKIEPRKITFRISHGKDILIRFMSYQLPAGIDYEVLEDLSWYECLFKKVQVDEAAILRENPSFDLIRRLWRSK